VATKTSTAFYHKESETRIGTIELWSIVCTTNRTYCTLEKIACMFYLLFAVAAKQFEPMSHIIRTGKEMHRLC